MKINSSEGESQAASTTPIPNSDDEPPSGCPLTSKVQPTAKPSWSNARWNDWRWQMAHRIRKPEQLLALFPSLQAGPDISAVVARYPMAITPYYASLIRRPEPSDPIFRMAVPQVLELLDPPFLSPDPLEEGRDMPVPGMVHRYRDRVLVIATTTCSTYCRHCTRKRVAGARECTISRRRLEQVTNYLTAHPEVKDVIISGGDPLTMSTEQLQAVLAAIRAVQSVEVMRIGTRVPVVLPQRITDELCQMLKRYHPIWINTHFNHPHELTQEAATACARLADAGIPLGNQSVLLRGVNDNPQVMEQLCSGLIRMRVRPYYLYQCDLVKGVEHFRTPVSRGIEIMEYLRGRVSGMAIPLFVVDAPHGGGKIPVLPSYVVSQSPSHTVLRNYEGMLISYPEPRDRWEPANRTQDQVGSGGVWGLCAGHSTWLQPATSDRLARRRYIQDPQVELTELDR
ncbi:MAG: KamA family radical SAM protein, partial [Sedimentisphaerales bacterium]|nr:KamA family radical SAM protein [Sedimentisphaerales bacterium]